MKKNENLVKLLAKGIDLENELLTIKIMVNRLVRFVWLGGYVLLFGTVIALWPDRQRRTEV